MTGAYSRGLQIAIGGFFSPSLYTLGRRFQRSPPDLLATDFFFFFSLARSRSYGSFFFIPEPSARV